MGKYILAIEFGTTKIACAAAERCDYGVRILTYKEAPSIGVTRGEIVNIKHVYEITRNLISQISQETETKYNSAVVGISVQFLKVLTESNRRTRKQTEDLISEEEIAELTEEMKNFKVGNDECIIDVIPQYYNIDDEIFGETDPAGTQGSIIEGCYKLIVSKKRPVENIKSTLQKLGIKPELFILRSNASAKAVLTEEDKEIGTVLIDFGGGTTEVTIIKDNIIRHNAIIPFGGDSITEDISTTFGISKKYAELLKIKHGSCFSDLLTSSTKEILITGADGRENKRISQKSLSLVIEARTVEIMEAVMYEIEKSGFKNDIAGVIVITGGGAQLLHLPTLVRTMTGFTVKVAYPTDFISEGSCDEIYSYRASTVAGLAIAGGELPYEEEEESSVTVTLEEPQPTVPVEEETAKVNPDETEAGKKEKKEKEKKEKSREKEKKIKISEIFRKIFSEDDEA